MPSLFWFEVDERDIDFGYGPGRLIYVTWVTGDYGMDELIPVTHGPQEPPFVYTAEGCLELSDAAKQAHEAWAAGDCPF